MWTVRKSGQMRKGMVCQAEGTQESREQRGSKNAGGHTALRSDYRVQADEAGQMGGHGNGGLYSPLRKTGSYPAGIVKLLSFKGGVS